MAASNSPQASEMTEPSSSKSMIVTITAFERSPDGGKGLGAMAVNAPSTG